MFALVGGSLGHDGLLLMAVIFGNRRERPDLTVGTKSESTVCVTHLVPRPAKEGGADLRKPSDLAIRRLFRESVVSNLGFGLQRR